MVSFYLESSRLALHHGYLDTHISYVARGLASYQTISSPSASLDIYRIVLIACRACPAYTGPTCSSLGLG